MKKLIAAIMALMIMVCGCSAAFAAKKTLSKEEAVEIALKSVKMEIEDVKFTKIEKDKDDGRLIWEIEFVRKGIEYEFDIDARTGKILEANKERYDGDDDLLDDLDDFFDFD